MIVLKTSHPEAISTAQNVINYNGLIVFPTDTVYGLASSAFDPIGIEKIYWAKNRPPIKSIPVLIGSIGQLNQIAAVISPLASRLIDHFWPGPLTIIVFKRHSLPPNLSSDRTVGVRMPNHKFTIDLLNTTGPLATTSANQSGQADSLTAKDAKNQIGDKNGVQKQTAHF